MLLHSAVRAWDTYASASAKPRYIKIRLTEFTSRYAKSRIVSRIEPITFQTVLLVSKAPTNVPSGPPNAVPTVAPLAAPPALTAPAAACTACIEWAIFSVCPAARTIRAAVSAALSSGSLLRSSFILSPIKQPVPFRPAVCYLFSPFPSAYLFPVFFLFSGFFFDACFGTPLS